MRVGLEHRHDVRMREPADGARLVQPLRDVGVSASGSSSLIATSRSSRASWPSQTVACAPRPSSRSSSKRPTRRVAGPRAGLRRRSWRVLGRGGSPGDSAARGTAAAGQRVLQVAAASTPSSRVRSAARRAAAHRSTLGRRQGRRVDGLVGAAGGGAQHVVVVVGRAHRRVRPTAGAPCAAPMRPGPSGGPRPRRWLDVGAQHRERAPVLGHAGLVGLARARRPAPAASGGGSAAPRRESGTARPAAPGSAAASRGRPPRRRSRPAAAPAPRAPRALARARSSAASRAAPGPRSADRARARRRQRGAAHAVQARASRSRGARSAPGRCRPPGRRAPGRC